MPPAQNRIGNLELPDSCRLVLPFYRFSLSTHSTLSTLTASSNTPKITQCLMPCTPNPTANVNPMKPRKPRRMP